VHFFWIQNSLFYKNRKVKTLKRSFQTNSSVNTDPYSHVSMQMQH